ncbi:MAG: cupin domain-containing protein [Nitrospirota bacterium]
MPSVDIERLHDGFFNDPKTGWSAYPFMHGPSGRDADIRGVHVVAISPGQVRGNHYHEKTNETLLVFSGRGVFYWEDGSGISERVIDREPTLIRIPPGVRHAFRNIGDDTVYLLAVRDGEFDPDNPDVVRSEVVKP